MSIRYTALSEIGLKMNENQDGLFCAADGESGIFLVADGMGGHQDGAWASAAIVKKTSVWWDGYRASLSRPGFFGGVEELKKIFSEVNQEIYSGTRGNFAGLRWLPCGWITAHGLCFPAGTAAATRERGGG